MRGIEQQTFGFAPRFTIGEQAQRRDVKPRVRVVPRRARERLDDRPRGPGRDRRAELFELGVEHVAVDAEASDGQHHQSDELFHETLLLVFVS